MPESSARVVIGASCGGGQASKTAVMYEDIKSMVLISPALRPHWIDPEYRQKLAKHTQLPVLAIATEDDKNAMDAVSSVFKENKSAKTQKIVYKGRIHGEPLFTHDPELLDYIVDWVSRTIK
jgi:alpha-beta hydrolase superfamily lysophospholipase